MELQDFDYSLPPAQIAARPAAQRDLSRLLVLPRAGGPVAERLFREIEALLEPGDVLVANDTRVIGARLEAVKPTGGRVELLLDRPAEAESEWHALAQASKPLRVGQRLSLPGGAEAVIAARGPTGTRVRLHGTGPILAYLERHGGIPLPPYIPREGADNALLALDRERYQTVYAEKPGAVAAPTAGLHFTKALLLALENRGVHLARVTLHVGPGTFLPVRTDQIDTHVMHPERYTVTPEAAGRIAAARRAGRRVIAVGTTVVRTLESTFDPAQGAVMPGEGLTDLFIRPGYAFRAIDGLITNFHLPRSTLLMLVCAFAGRERVLEAYAEAVRRGFHFYSYGDAMACL